MIHDSRGNVIDTQNSKIDYAFPSEKNLEILKPGEQIVSFFDLYAWFRPSKFQRGETYTFMAVYQNGIDITKTIDGIEVPSWVGSVRSNEETFIILP